MLSAIAVAVALVEPVLLDRVPITPELLAGRWEMVYTSLPLLLENLKTVVYGKDGSCVITSSDRRTGKVKSIQGGTYIISSPRVDITMEHGARGASNIKLLQSGRMRTMNVVDGSTISVYKKLDNR